MTREERAELTIRVAGVVFLTATLGGLVPLLQFAGLLGHQAHTDSLALGSAVTCLVYTLAGYAFVFRSRTFAGLLRARDEGEGHEVELLRAGVFLLGVYYVFGFCLTAATAGAVGTTAGMIFAAAAAVVFLARPRALIARLAGRARAGCQFDGLGMLVGAGIALLALAVLTQSLSRGLVQAFRSPPPPAPPEMARLMNLMTEVPARAYVSAACGVALSLLAIAFCGRLGAWLARGAGETPLDVAGRMGKQGWIVFGVVCVPLAGGLKQLTVPNGIGASQLPVPYSVVQAAVLIGLPVLAAFVARPIARALYPEEPDKPGSRAALVVALETAITVLALYYGLVAFMLTGLDLRLFIGLKWPILLMLAFRGDVARWYAWPRADEEEPKPSRTATLQVGLGLLGAYLLLLGLSRLPALAATSFGWIRQSAVVSVGASHTELSWPDTLLPVAGLALVLAARPLGRLLSYGPLLHSVWGLGWTRKGA